VTSYLFQRISLTLQRFNSVLLQDTLPVDLPDILILAFLFLTLRIFRTWSIKNKNKNKNNNNNNSHDNVYGAVIMTKVIARVHPVHLMNAD